MLFRTTLHIAMRNKQFHNIHKFNDKTFSAFVCLMTQYNQTEICIFTSICISFAKEISLFTFKNFNFIKTFGKGERKRTILPKQAVRAA